MGCFLACFGSEKRRRSANKKLPRDRIHGNYEPPKPDSSFMQPRTEEAELLIPSRDKPEEQNLSSRKKVTFDLNVKTYVKVSVDEIPHYSSETDDEKDGKKEEEKEKKGNQSISPSRIGDYPSNHRYQNCSNSDEEDEVDEDEIEYEDSDFDDDSDGDDNIVEVEVEEEESFSSCFSLPMKEENNSKTISDSGSPDRKPALLAKSNARDRSQYVHSVLNPVENLSQWKAVKARTAPLKHQKKENIGFDELQIPISSEPTFKAPKPQKSFDSSPKKEIRVDTSLSNWLVSPEATQTTKTSITHTNSSEKSESITSYSSRYNEDRPILGALTVEEIKQSLSTSSPRRSPSRSPDDIPILGTVGSYWNHMNKTSDFKGIPNTTSKYQEDKRVNWHSTPFEVRLERALNKGVADADSSYPPGIC